MSRLVLDVWAGNETINLAAWKALHDVWGVIVKCGGHEYLNGEKTKTYYGDRCFEDLYESSVKNGLHTGTFYYSTATTADEARKEAEHALRLLDGRDFDLPVYMDVEEREQFGIGPKLTDVVMAFCETIEDAGYKAGIYSGSEGFYLMDDVVCKYSLWLAYWGKTRPSWASPERGYDLWQQGSMNYAGNKVYDDGGAGYVDYDWWIGEEEEDDVSTFREKVVAKAKEQLGVDYYSMNYSAQDGWGGMGTHYVGHGWGCAQLASYTLNTLLGTKYVGSCWNFAGDALGQSVNQGGGEFEFIDEWEAQPGDFVLYVKSGYDSKDYNDYGHIAIYIGNNTVIGAMGRGKPTDWNYLNIGVSRTTIAAQELGGGYRFIRCKRLDVDEDINTETVEKESDMHCLIHPQGSTSIYYWDGSPETVPYHLSPEEMNVVKDIYKAVNGGTIPTVRPTKEAFDKILKMTKGRKAWREEDLKKALSKEQAEV